MTTAMRRALAALIAALATVSALAGGTTTIMPFARQTKKRRIKEVVEEF